MNDDPSVNVVVFELERNGRLEMVGGEGPTRAPDGIRRAWHQVQMRTGDSETVVRSIYSEWEPSPEDYEFIANTFTFPGLKVTYSFRRPSSDKWDEAMAEVGQAISEAFAKDMMKKREEEKESRVPLPVLRNRDMYSDLVVNFSLLPDLGIYLANIGLTPRETIGIDYVLYKNLEQEQVNLEDLWQEAFNNLAVGIKVECVSNQGHDFFIVTREKGLAASAIGLSNFFQNASGWVNSKNLIVGIPDPNVLLVCDAGSPEVNHFKEIISKSDYYGAVNLTPCVLLLNGDKITLVSKRKEP